MLTEIQAEEELRFTCLMCKYNQNTIIPEDSNMEMRRTWTLGWWKSAWDWVETHFMGANRSSIQKHWWCIQCQHSTRCFLFCDKSCFPVMTVGLCLYHKHEVRRDTRWEVYWEKDDTGHRHVFLLVIIRCQFLIIFFFLGRVRVE